MTNLEQQYKNLSLEERMKLAVAPLIEPAYRVFMLHEQWMQIKCYFARRADLSAAEITQLSLDDDHVIRLCVAKRHDLPLDTINRFVSDRDPNVRYFIARNPLLTQAQRERLMNDSDVLVRRAAEKGPRAMAYRQRPGQAKLVK